MQTNHTPGPWIAEGSALTIAPALEGANRRHLATFHGHATESDRLKIAAAPEMLDRLHLWRNWAECAEPADQVPPQLYAATLETLGKADPDMNWADGETFDRLSRVRNEAPAVLAALRKAQELLRDLESPAHLDEGAALDDEITAILARIDGTPTDEPAPPTKGIAETVAMGLWRAKAAKEITARKAPKKFAPVFAGIKWAAFSIACELRGLDPEFDPAGFMAAAGYPGEF